MGRGRIPMELIQKEKAQKTTFQKRKQGLMKKVYEFSTLCGMNICAITYAPNFEGERFAKPKTWPNGIGKVHRIIEKYYNTTSDRRPKIFDVQDYYKERIKKVEDDISKVRKEMLKHEYPTWDESFNALGDVELRMFGTMLDARLDACNQKMNMLKEDIKGKATIAESENPYLASHPNSHFNLMPQPHHYPPLMTNENSLAFRHEFQLGQSSQPSMFHYGHNGVMSLGGDQKFAMVKKDKVDSNQNFYYNGNAQSYPLNYFGNSDCLPVGFQVNGFYDIDIFQPQV